MAHGARHPRRRSKARAALVRRPAAHPARPRVAPPPPAALPATLALAGLGLSQSGFTETERAALMGPFVDEQIEIKPSGEVYVSHIFIRNRLSEIFGPGNWGLLPEDPVDKQGQLIQKWTLLIRGRPVAAAYGEARYIANNPRHSWGKALEAAKSNALTRCAKDISLAARCWERRWQFSYRMRHGVLVKVRVKDRIETQWRHVDSPPLSAEISLDDRSPNADRYQPPTAARRAAAEASWRPATEDEQPTVEAQEARAAELVPFGDGLIDARGHRQLRGAMRTHQRSEADVKAFLKKQWGYGSTAEIRQSQLNAVLDYVRAPYDV